MSCKFVPNFEAISCVTLVLRPEKRSKVTCKTQSHSTSCLKIPFHPYQPTFGHDEVCFFFDFWFFIFLFFSSLIVCAVLLLHHKPSKSNFCVKLLSCRHNFVSQNFLGHFSGNPPKWGPKISIFEPRKLEHRFFLYQSIFITQTRPK